MYEDVLDESAQEALWAEHPEAFEVDSMREQIATLEEELSTAERQRDAYKDCIEFLSGVAELLYAAAESRLSVEP